MQLFELSLTNLTWSHIAILFAYNSLVSSGQFYKTTTESFLNSRFKWTSQFGKRLKFISKTRPKEVITEKVGYCLKAVAKSF